jgi:hypothetical protein
MRLGLCDLVPGTRDKYVRYLVREDSLCIEGN